MNKFKYTIFILAIALGIIYLMTSYFNYNLYKKPIYVTEEVNLGNIQNSFSATGVLDALVKVEVGCQITGIISSISVDFNSIVKEGQQIAQIDPSTFEAQLQQALANLESAKATVKYIESQIKTQYANLANLNAEEKIAKANIEKAKATLLDAERQYKRIIELHEKKLISSSEKDNAETNFLIQKSALESAYAQLESVTYKKEAIKMQIEATQSELESAKSKVAQMEAQLKIAEINLSRTKIYSPIDGIVISRKVDVGQTVAASLQAPTLFTIANDLKKMIINISVDEADIGKVKPNQDIIFTVDAYKNKKFKGKITQIRLSPVISQNVVTYSVIAQVDNSDLTLLPGMTANVEILVENKQNVLLIPTKALFYKPSDVQIRNKFTEYEKSSENTKNRNTEFNQYAYSKDYQAIWIIPKDETKQQPEPKLIFVKLGIYNNEYTEITEGPLKPGDLVIVDEKQSSDKSEYNVSNKSSLSSSKWPSNRPAHSPFRIRLF